MSQLIETRWKRYGKDRVYVKTVEGNDVGHVDLVERTVVTKIADYEAELRECLARWTTGAESAPQEAESVVPAPTAESEADCEAEPPATEPSILSTSADNDGGSDLATNVAGAAARAKRDEVNAQAGR